METAQLLLIRIQLNCGKNCPGKPQSNLQLYTFQHAVEIGWEEWKVELIWQIHWLVSSIFPIQKKDKDINVVIMVIPYLCIELLPLSG